MLDSNERIELLINRKLDGRLSGDEELELDRALIRSPEHRRIWEVSQRLDALCSETLREELRSSAPDGRVACSPLTFRTGKARRESLGDSRNVKGEALGEPVRAAPGHATLSGRWWWFVPGALAACLGLMLFTGRLSVPGNADLLELVEGRPTVPISAQHPALGNGETFSHQGGMSVVPPISGGRNDIRRVSTGPSMLSRQRESNVYGIVGDDGRIYIIELERTRMYHYPRRSSSMRFVRDDL